MRRARRVTGQWPDEDSQELDDPAPPSPEPRRRWISSLNLLAQAPQSSAGRAPRAKPHAHSRKTMRALLRLLRFATCGNLHTGRVVYDGVRVVGDAVHR